MSTTKIITIICWIVSALVLIGLVIWFLTGSILGSWGGNWSGIRFPGINVNSFENLSGPFNSQGTQTVDMTNLHSLNINWVSGEITIVPHDGNEIHVTEFAQRSLRDNETLRMNTDGGTLTIRFRERDNNVGNMPRKNLEVLVPRELSENLTRLSVNTISGGISVKDFEASTVNLSSVSAEVEITGIVSQSIDINTTSGAITASSIRAGRLDTDSVSGATNISEALVTTLKVNTISGRASTTGEFDDVDVSTVSGGAMIRSSAVPGKMSVSTVSGAIDVHIPNTGEITVSHSAVSGRFSSEIPVIMQNGGAYKFSSVSGNTNIYVLG